MSVLDKLMCEGNEPSARGPRDMSRPPEDTSVECLFQIGNDVVDVFSAY